MFFCYLQAQPKEEVEHADILELNTIIGTLRQEKELLEQEKVCLRNRFLCLYVSRYIYGQIGVLTLLSFHSLICNKD